MDIEPTFNDYLRMLQRRKWLVLAIASVVSVSSAMYSQMQVPLYRATAVVKYEPPGQKIIGMDLVNYDQMTALRAQVRLIESEDLRRSVAQRRGNKPGAAYSATPMPDSNFVAISATGPDPLVVADVANAVLEVYMEKELDERSMTTKKTLQDITSRRADMEASLSELEDRRKTYLEQHPAMGVAASMGSGLIEMETRRAELLKKFTPEHPDVVALDQKISMTRARMAKDPGTDLDLERINRDIRVNEEIYVALSRQMEETKVALSLIPPFATLISRATVPAAPFFPNKSKSISMGCIFGLLLGVMAAFMLESLDISISTIEDIEKVVGVPVLGVVPHLGSEKRWQAFKSKLLREERYPTDAFRSLLLFHQSERTPTVEVYHSIRSAIESHQSSRDHWVLTFTSTGVAEGKTLTSVNFCLAAAHAGLKTLLIGSDIRRPVVHRVFGLPKQPGLMEVLAGKMEWQDVIRGTVDFLMGEIDLDKLLGFSGIDNFKVMTSWTASSADIVNVFSSPKFPKFIEEIRPHFDLIVFDCPPVLLFVDAALIGAQTDGVVMVYQAGKMARQALRRAKDQLVGSKANIIGVVLNDMHSSDMGPGYAGYYGYGHYAKKEED